MSLFDFYTENGKPVLVLKDEFIRLSVARVVKDDERTLDKFTAACGLSDDYKWLREWSKALEAGVYNRYFGVGVEYVPDEVKDKAEELFEKNALGHYLCRK